VAVLTNGHVSRRDRKHQKTREAILDAAYTLITQHGVDAVTMLEIAELADMGAGTVYNYFASKDELAFAVMDKVVLRMAERIHKVTKAFKDPADVYAYRIRSMMKECAESRTSDRLLSRAVVVADVFFDVMGPIAIGDLNKASSSGFFKVDNPELTWRLMTHAIIGFGIEVRKQHISIEAIDECLVKLLGLSGVGSDVAARIATKKWPDLPPG